jgi:hypothetical protein
MQRFVRKSLIVSGLAVGAAVIARFNGSVGPLPSVCASEPDIAFLIRVGAGRWIANGTVLR